MENELPSYDPTPNKPSIYDDTQFTLKVTNLSRNNPLVSETNNDLQDIIYFIDWQLTADYISPGGEEYVLSMNGQTGLGEPSTENFISYENLTENIIESWIIDGIPMLHHKYTLCNRILSMFEEINNDKNGLPWNT